MDTTTPEQLEALKAILYMISVLVALEFVGLFKGRWFFLLTFCFIVGNSEAAYTVYNYKNAAGHVILSCRPGPGSTETSIMALLGFSPYGQQWKCPYYPAVSGHTHSDFVYNYVGCGGAAYCNGSAGPIYCCPVCLSSWGSALTRVVVQVGEDKVPTAVYDDAQKGTQTGVYGEKTTTTIVYGSDGVTPIGYTVNSVPPDGVTPTYDENGAETGYKEGHFVTNADGTISWEYYPGYETLSADSLKNIYATFSEWFAKWQTQDANFTLTRAQFQSYMTASLARGSSINEAILALNPAKPSDIAAAKSEIVAALQNINSGASAADVAAASASIVAAINDIPSGTSSGGEGGTVNLAPIQTSLDAVKTDIHSLVSDSDVVIDEDIDGEITIPEPVEPSESIEIKEYFTSWETGLNGLLGQGLNFSFNYLFGQVPDIGTQSTFEMPELDLPFGAHVGGLYSLPPNIDSAVFRSIFLFILLIGFAFKAWKIISDGMDI